MDFKIAFICLCAAAFSGCASMSREYDASRAQGVRKVAIVSFEIQAQKPRDSLGFSGINEMKDGDPADGPAMQAMAQAVQARFAHGLADTTSWKVSPPDAVAANGVYRGMVQEKMSGAHRVSITNGDTLVVVPKGFLGNAQFRMMSDADRGMLARSLGVDALAEVVLINNIDQGFGLGNLTGNAPFTYKTRANLMVFSVDSAKPLWRIQNVDGADSRNSSELPKEMEKYAKMAKIGEESAENASQKLLAEYPGKAR